MRRLTAGGIALFAMTWAGSALALALGEIDVRSHLNESFLAVVPVVAATEEELDSLTVQVADNGEFVRAGIDRNDYLSSLQLSVVKLPNGSSLVKIRSSEIAREPVLSFVLEARWSTGRLVREYTSLLDPQSNDLSPAPRTAPSVVTDGATPVPPAASSEAQPANPRRRVKPTPTPSQAPSAAAESAAGSYGPVAANETLWSIATRVQQSVGGTIDQVLLELYRKNPAAFEGGSINRLMKGMTLSTPSAAEVQSVDAATAQRRVAELRGLIPAAKEPLPAAGTVAAKPEAAKPEAPKAQPTTSLEGGQAASAAATQSPPAEPAVKPSADATTAASPAPASSEPAPVVAPEASNPPPAPVVAAPAPAAPRPEVGGSLPLPVLAAAGAVLLLGVLGFLAIRRRRAIAAAVAGAAEFADIPEIRVSEKEPPDILIEPQTAAELAVPRKPSSPDADPAPRFELEPVAQTPPPASVDSVKFETAPPAPLPGLATSADITDPLTDADFHLSYGLHEEAANILKSALLKEPNRLELKRKLADVYFAGRRGLEFQALAEELRSQVDTAEWKHIVELGRQLVPNAPLFKPTQSAQPYGVLPDIDLNEFDLSGDGLKPAAPAAPKVELPAVAAVPPPLDINSFDLAKVSEDRPDRIEFNLDELDLATPEEGAPSFAIGDEFDTKLDLARAYADMGDTEAALNLLSEVVTGGNEKQKLEAKTLHDRLKA